MAEINRDEEVREHMRLCPDHELTIDSDEEWRCLTCEADEEDHPEYCRCPRCAEDAKENEDES